MEDPDLEDLEVKFYLSFCILEQKFKIEKVLIGIEIYLKVKGLLKFT